MREGRLVLVLQAGSRGRVRGLTHGRSGTGKSFYFEPLEAVDENNALQQAVEDEEAERRRILAELADEAGRAALPDVAAHVALRRRPRPAAGVGPLRRALRGAGWRTPRRPATLALRGARHPLLVAGARGAARAGPRLLRPPGRGGPARPRSEWRRRGRRGGRALVITGPNAGGKTVALKTVGLLALAHQCGLPVPAAAGTALPVSPRRRGDGRRRAGPADRPLDLQRPAAPPQGGVGGGRPGEPDPPRRARLRHRPGGGLRRSPSRCSKGLLARRALAVITTHLTQLAAAALEMDGAACAAMEFSGATGEPTYRLLPGPPGASEALALGAPPRAARRVARPGRGAPRHRAPEAAPDARRGRAGAPRARGRAGAGRAGGGAPGRRARGAGGGARGVGGRAQGRGAQDQGGARRLPAGDPAALPRRGRADRGRGRRRGGARGSRPRRPSGCSRPRRSCPRSSPRPTGPLVVGERVRHRGFGWEGELLSARARARPRCRCAASASSAPRTSWCRWPEGGGEAPKAKGRGRRRARAQEPARRCAGPDLAAEAPVELHLLGERVEPALKRLDDYLDQALLASRSEVRVVHGHGSGQLRRAVREHLRGHPAVASHRAGAPKEGGDGATVVVLKGA